MEAALTLIKNLALKMETEHLAEEQIISELKSHTAFLIK